ncbi:hypothetical protein BH11PLA1_BH11PLA1_01530 [soil metagenome]
MNLRTHRRVSATALLSLGALANSAVASVTAPILDPSGATLTSYAVSAQSLRQFVRPLPEQRGVDLDGALRASSPLDMAIAGDPAGGGVGAWRKVGDIDLATGAYSPTDVDMRFATLGPSGIIGRTYNHRQVFSAAHLDSNGLMGANWFQSAMPEIILYDADANPATKGATDVLYIVYGADRYIELARTASNSNDFKAKNGAAGVAVFAADATYGDTYTYTDQRGTQSVFFGFNAAAGTAGGQLWSATDAAGQSLVVHSTTKATALSSYTSNGGLMQSVTDASGRAYTMTYSSVGGVNRLTKVEGKISGTTFATTDYAYYTTTVAGLGLAGDLQTVAVTIPTGAGNITSTKYYRYYTSAWSNATGSRGNPHAVKLVVGAEGVRRYGVSNLAAATDAQLEPYADAWLEYVSGSDYRVSKAFFNGECGCSGGTNGTYEFTYGQSSSYSTYVGNTSYDTGWATRTVVKQPDGNYQTHYFDEVGQPLAKATTNADPAGSPSKTWATFVTRNADGQVEQLALPDATTYTHSGGVFGYTGVGLVQTYTLSTSGNLTGLRTDTAVQFGNAGGPVTVSSRSLSDHQLSVGTSGVSIAKVTDTSTYPTVATALTTSYNTVYQSATTTDPLYLMPFSVTVTNPLVSTGKNGSNSATTSAAYFRADGSGVFSTTEAGIIHYSGRDAYGRSSRMIADADSAATGDFLSGDSPSTWSVSSTGTPIHVTTDLVYDAQDRTTSRTQPSVAGTRTSVMAYAALSDGRTGQFSIPRFAGSTYYGPISYGIVNQAGKQELNATLAVTSGGTGSLPSTTPGGTWSSVMETIYDNAGHQRTASRAYTGSYSGGTYDETTFAYDTMGRPTRTQDPTGTIRKSTFDERGLRTESWIGTNDGGSSDMTMTEKYEYDANSAGGNGWMTKRVQDADGNWGTTTDQRTSETLYDFRGRAIVRLNPLAPHQVMKYDNADRVIATGVYSANSIPLAVTTNPVTTSSTRVGLNEQAYDERGQVYQAQQHEVDPSSGALGSAITTKTWYDAEGRTVKVMGAQVSKMVYDRLGRSVGRLLLASSAGTTYASAMAPDSNDLSLEESWSAIHAATGRVLMQHTVQRKHDDSSTTGALSGALYGLSVNPATNSGRTQISAMWYDALDRVSDSVNFGTHGGSTYNRSGASVPAPTDTELVTSTTYDDAGRVAVVTDVQGVPQVIDYDLLGRRIRVTDNYVDGTAGGGTNNDQDRIVEYVYTNGLVTSVTRKMPSGTSDQVTTSVYGTTKGSGGNAIGTGHLLRETIYPPQYTTPGVQAPADRTTTCAYNALAQVSSTIDPSGNVIDITYDALGRGVTRTATTIVGGFDSRVKYIETDYNSRGQMSAARQKNASSVVLDEITWDYDGWGMPATVTSDPDSAVGAATGRDEFIVTHSWSLAAPTNAWQTVYDALTGQPGSVTVARSLGTANRVINLTDQNSVKIAEYKYLGANSVISVNHVEPSIAVQYYGSAGSSTYGTFLDQFNRPILHTWRKTAYTGADEPRFIDMAVDSYNRYGQPLQVRDQSLAEGTATNTPTFDLLTVIDDLRRPISRDEGELTTGAITTLRRDEVLARTLAGRIGNDKVNLNGLTGTPTATKNYNEAPPAASNGEMDDTRVYNDRNELTSRGVIDSAHLGGMTITLTYDKNGNLTDDGEKFEYVYNPFCQLVEVKETGGSHNTQAKFTYNALSQRISEQLDINDSGNSGAPDAVVDSYDPIMFLAVDGQGRRIATFRDTDTDPIETFIHHDAGVAGPALGGQGGPLLRDRDDVFFVRPDRLAYQAASSTRAERLYYCADFQGKVSSLIRQDGTLGETYRYSATGVPFGIPLGDVNSDGVVDTADYNEVKAMGYHVRGDLDLDGIIFTVDYSGITSSVGKANGRGSRSDSSINSHVEASNRESFDNVALSFLDRSVSLSNISIYSMSSCVGSRVPIPDWQERGCPPGFIYDPFRQVCMRVLYGTIPGCPLTDPGPATGDGWCLDSAGGGHCDLKCYRSYGTGTTAGQQCCYEANGQLSTNPDCMGTVDFIGCATGEDSGGSCNRNYFTCKDHWQVDVRPWKSCERLYNEFHCCLRQHGIPSGTPTPFGPAYLPYVPWHPDDSDLETARAACAKSVYRDMKIFCNPPSTAPCSRDGDDWRLGPRIPSPVPPGLR